MIISALIIIAILIIKILLPIIAIVKFCVDGDLAAAIICLALAIMLGSGKND